MVAGIGVLAAPVAILAVGGYALAKRRNNARLAAALGQAISSLYDIQDRLIANAEYYREEITRIRVAIDTLQLVTGQGPTPLNESVGRVSFRPGVSV